MKSFLKSLTHGKTAVPPDHHHRHLHKRPGNCLAYLFRPHRPDHFIRAHYGHLPQQYQALRIERLYLLLDQREGYCVGRMRMDDGLRTGHLIYLPGDGIFLRPLNVSGWAFTDVGALYHTPLLKTPQPDTLRGLRNIPSTG